jgi:hypothetical protein
MSACPDCGVAPGTVHVAECDVARCAVTGFQRLACSGFYDHDHGQDAWTGTWPGVQECEELGWYARLVPGEGWVPCSPDEPGATHDINRLVTEGRWDTERQRWLAANGPAERRPS